MRLSALLGTSACCEVVVRVAGSGGARPLVAVAVADTGSGIAPDLLPRVFDRFAKEVGSPGTGLGIAISSDLVEAHGGTIHAQSEPGRATTVTFTLPAPEPGA